MECAEAGQTAREASLHRDLANLEKALADKLALALRGPLVQRRRELEAELRRLHFTGELAAPMATTRPIDTAQLRWLVDQTGPIVLYYSAPSQVVGFLFLPGRHAPLVRLIPLPWERLGTLTTDLRTRLANPQRERQPDTPALLRQAYDLLIAPFATDLAPFRGRPLVLVPHGPLHQLPFDALLDPKQQPLHQRWPLSVSPSLSALWLARRRASSSAAARFALFSAGTGLYLPDEVALGLAGRYGMGAEALFLGARFLDYGTAAPRARQVLLTTHGYHVQGSRDETYLELSPMRDGSHDNRLRASEIARIPLDADLVILAACETAQGEALLSDERLDLSRAFLAAGARTVVATRWKLPAGEQTYRFLQELHGLLAGQPGRKPLPPVLALAQARTLAHGWGAPAALWAAFVLIGDPGAQ